MEVLPAEPISKFQPKLQELPPSNLSATKYLNRQWIIISNGITGFNANITLSYISGDLSGGAVSSELKVYQTTTSTSYPSFTSGVNSFTISNLSDFGVFGAAECEIITISAATVTDVTCFGGNNGAIDINISGGVSPFTYNWTSTGSFTSSDKNISGLSAGTYNITVTDAAGCTGTNLFEIDEPDELTATSIQNNPVVCNGESNGKATVTVSGGTSPYSYSWDKSSSTSASATDLAAGDHTITVTDDNGCQTTILVTISQPDELNATAIQDNPVVCNGESNGKATVTVSGGTSPYSYSWDKSSSTSASATDLAAGNHTITVTDDNGCQTTTLVTISQPDELNATAIQDNPVVCNGESNGKATVTVSGGTSPYSYSWDKSSSTSASATDLAAGDHTIIVTDDNGCQTTTLVTISQPDELNATAIQDNPVVCNGESNGKATVTVSGGTSPYSYSWDKSSSTSASATDLAAGDHTITVTDDKGCQTTALVTIIQPNPISFGIPTITDVTCSGEDDGQIIISASDGTGAINYSINPNTGSQSTSGTFTELSAQPYTITATDANNCTAIVDVTVGTVNDVTVPVISGCPADITFYTNDGIPANCNQSVTWTEPTASDDCALATFTSNYSPGDAFPVGTTTVTYTATDAAGNNATCTFDIIVVDNTPPAFTVPVATTIYTENNCTVDRSPSKTGNIITTLKDNCTLNVNLKIPPFYSDEPDVPGTCIGNYSFIRTWNVEDEAGNKTTKTQTITVVDNDAPVFDFVPKDIEVQCGIDLSEPANTGGSATAVDACGSEVSISFTDEPYGSGCSYSLTRVWTATDECGNKSTATQVITVSDTKPPTITNIAHQTIDCPIVPDPDISVITATDECGVVNVVLYDERTLGLDDQPGYCPASVERDYLVSDGCGNTIIATQIITITGESYCWPDGTCARCYASDGNDGLEAFHVVDFTGDPDAEISFPAVKRTDKCCVELKWNEYCASFNVKLDEDAIGIEVVITEPAAGGQEWMLNCSYDKPITGGKFVCLPGGEFNLFTYCKKGQGSGNLENDWYFRSISGVVVEKEIDTRVDCNTKITTSGVYDLPEWTTVFPTDDDYTKYLYDPLTDPDHLIPGSGRTVASPEFVAPIGAVGTYQFEICADVGEPSICNTEGGRDCDIVTINVVPEINIDLQINPDLMCEYDLPFELTPYITPVNGNYKIEWFNEYNAISTNYLGESTSWTISDEGAYSIKVTDLQEGIECNTATFNFDTEIDETGPTYATLPGPLEISCDDPDWQQKIIDWRNSFDATYIDADGITRDALVTDDFSFDDFDLSCHVHDVNFIAVDLCDNKSPELSSITVYDDKAPTASNPLPINVECIGDVPAWDITVVTDEADNCTTNPVVAFVSDVSDNATCPETITRTYSVTDACGNQITVIQLITVGDATAPTFDAPADISSLSKDVDCGYDADPSITGNPTNLADNCTAPGSLVIEYSDDAVGGTCEGQTIITRTWKVTDECGNFTEHDQIITILDNVEYPTASNPLPINVECIGDVPAWDITVVTDEADNCTTNPVVAFVSDVSDNATCPETITRTYSVTDACGNQITVIQLITVGDATAPTFDAPADISSLSKDVDCGYDADPSITGNPTNLADNCTAPGSLVIEYSDDAVGGTCEGQTIITRTWKVTDECGNFTEHDQIITMLDNVEYPTASNPLPINVECIGDVPAWDITVVTDEADNCTTNPVVAFVSDVSDNATCPETITRTYSVTDACGNQITVIQLITVGDATAPTFDAPADISSLSKDVDCGYDADPSITGNPTNLADNCTAPGSLVIEYSDDAVGGTCEGQTIITRTWKVTDECGNFTEHDQIITILDNVEYPTASNPLPINVECIGDVPAWDITVVTDEADNCTTNPVVAFVSDVSDNATCPETITRTYSVTDACGNQITVIQLITVGDATAPTFDAPADISSLSKDVDCGYDADPSITGNPTNLADNCTAPGSLVIEYSDDAVGGTCEGQTIITRTWKVTDECGNFTEHDQIITVLDNVEYPTASNPLPINVECIGDVPAWDITVVTDEADNCTTNPVVAFVSDVSDNATCPETITRTYSVTDACGNQITVIQLITVGDATAPTFDAPADISSLSKDVDCGYDADPSITGNPTNLADNCTAPGSLVIEYSDDAVGGTCEGQTIITRTWKVTDECGNFTEHDQIITVLDNVEYPTASNPLPINVECIGDVPAWDITVVTDEADNCTTNPVVAFVSDVSDNATCPETITRTYSVTDACGNQITVIQLITVGDATAPTFDAPADISSLSKDVDCGYDADPSITGNPTNLADNCTAPGSLVIEYSDDAVGGTCEGQTIITRTWKVTDECGNFTEHDQIITVLDNVEYPTASNPLPINVECIGDVPAWDITVVTDEADNCTTNPVVAFVSDVSDNATCPETITRTYSVTDACGNSITVTQLITVNDITAPTVDCPITGFITPTDFNETFKMYSIPVFDYSDNCTPKDDIDISWTISGVTSGSGTGIIPDPYQFNTGTSTITYTFKDECGNSTECQFDIVVDLPPLIKCPDNILTPTDANVCTATLIRDSHAYTG